jgi:guanylate kinase
MSTIFIISAPSGSGKSTLVDKLLERDTSLLFSISYTTREPRGQEENGKHYHYISREEFERRLANGEFLEHALVFGQHYYGTHRSILDQAIAEGKDLVLDIDVQGARQLKDKFPEAVSVFILAPSREILEKRLRTRSEDAEAVIERRLRTAAAEIRNWKDYDYVLVNEQVEDSTETLLSIVRAERVRRCRMGSRIAPILATFEK